jgi:hypothetical protein
VVFDPSIRETIAVGLTAAGVLDAVLVSPALVPLAKAAGLPLALDLRGKFTSGGATAIYTWAREKFFEQCSKHVIIWLGGVCGDTIHPAIADWGVSQKAFFTDLDTRPDAPGSAAAEFALAESLVSSLRDESTLVYSSSGTSPLEKVPMVTPPLVCGWHSYCKDFEHTFTAMTSRHGGRVHGLNTNPNLSFMHALPLPANFSFRNKHHARRQQHRYIAPHDSVQRSSPHVYVTLVQTDGLGLGAWTKSGRGSLQVRVVPPVGQAPIFV